MDWRVEADYVDRVKHIVKGAKDDYLHELIKVNRSRIVQRGERGHPQGKDQARIMYKFAREELARRQAKREADVTQEESRSQP